MQPQLTTYFGTHRETSSKLNSCTCEDSWEGTAVLTKPPLLFRSLPQYPCYCLVSLFTQISLYGFRTCLKSPPRPPSPALWLSLFLSSDCSIEGISKATGLKINTMGDSIKSPWMVYVPWSSLHRVAFPQVWRSIPYVGIELLNRSMTGTLLLLLLTRWKDP